MMMNLMTVLAKKVFISSKPSIVCLLCPPPCGPFSIQEIAVGGLSYKVKKRMCLGTFSRRGAVASATIYPCAECASSRSVFIVWKRSFLYDKNPASTTEAAQCCRGRTWDFIMCLVCNCSEQVEALAAETVRI